MPDCELFLIGAATRAIAEMALRAGLTPGSFDAYADYDLSKRVGFLEQITLTKGRPSVTPVEFQNKVGLTPWLYTGPLENAPDWLDEAAQSTTLWGNSAATCRSVRDIFKLQELVRSQKLGISVPETRPATEPPARLGHWLYKPHRGTGGWEIVEARKCQPARALRPTAETAAGYFQKRIKGACFGATVASDLHEAVVLGLCRSLHGSPDRPFAYAGSEGPVCSHDVRKIMPELTRLARLLCRTFGLRGLWNIDLVHEPRKHEWHMLEVNPRPSASMEVLELASQKSIFTLHHMIFEGRHEWLGRAKQLAEQISQAEIPIRKKIIYAKRKFRATEEAVPLFDPNLWSPSRHCDLPWPETVIEAGEPIMTHIIETA